jgi:hypothetical protein
MSDELVQWYVTVTLQSIRAYTRDLPRNLTFQRPTSMVFSDGEEGYKLNDPTLLLLTDLFRLAFYSNSTTMQIRRVRRRTVVHYSGGPEPTADMVLPAIVQPVLIMSLINMIEHHWTKNDEHVLEGYIPLSWSLEGDPDDYRAHVRIWPEREWMSAAIEIRPWGSDDDSKESRTGPTRALPNDPTDRELSIASGRKRAC